MIWTPKNCEILWATTRILVGRGWRSCWGTERPSPESSSVYLFSLGKIYPIFNEQSLIIINKDDYWLKNLLVWSIHLLFRLLCILVILRSFNQMRSFIDTRLFFRYDIQKFRFRWAKEVSRSFMQCLKRGINRSCKMSAK